MPVHTPWGPAQSTTKIADGITFYSTAGHGGILLSGKRWMELKKILPSIQTFVGMPGWLEEDCDYFYAVFCFPECWEDDYAMVGVVSTLKAGHLNYIQQEMEAGNALCIEQFRIVSERAERWNAVNEHNWTAGSMGSTKTRGIWQVWFTQVGSRERRIVLMPYPEKLIYTTEELDAFEQEQSESLQTAETDF